jgi:hypothetical protein
MKARKIISNGVLYNARIFCTGVISVGGNRSTRRKPTCPSGRPTIPSHIQPLSITGIELGPHRWEACATRTPFSIPFPRKFRLVFLLCLQAILHKTTFTLFQIHRIFLMFEYWFRWYLVFVNPRIFNWQCWRRNAS